MSIAQLRYGLYHGATRGGPLVLANGTGNKQPDCLLMGGGTNADPILMGTEANVNGFDFRLKSTAVSGTTRGIYYRLALTDGAGGETIRAFLQCEDNTPADTVNGAHISLGFGSSAGNVTGLGTAGRFTLHVPNRSLTGTTAAIMAEVYHEGSSSVIGGTTSFFRCVASGHATGIANFDDNGFVLDIAGLNAGAAHAFRTGLTAATINAATTAALRIKVGATTYFIPIATATA